MVAGHGVFVEQEDSSARSGQKGGERSARTSCAHDHNVVFVLFQAGVLTALPFEAPSLDSRAGAKSQGYRLPLNVIGRRVWLAAPAFYAELMMTFPRPQRGVVEAKRPSDY